MARITHHVLRFTLLLFFFAQALTAATQTSLTSDEGPQLTSGYSYLVTGDPHLIEFDGHPPLAKVINALPLLLAPDLGSPVDVPAWQSDDPISLVWVAEQFFYPYRPLDRLVVATRVPVALLGVLLAALVYRWANDLFGSRGGLLALSLVTFDPNLLAHAGLATNDLAVTVACFAAMFTFWRFLRRPTLRRALLSGLVLGLAQGAKLNALLLLPTQALLALVYLQILNPKPRIPSFVLRLSSIWLLAALTLWATYGFELRTLPGWPLPLPAGTHLLLWERVTEATGGGHPGFLMGEISTEGWWHYFPVAFAIKTPLPALLVLLGAMVAFGLGHRRGWTNEMALGIFPLLYAAVTIFSRLNIGYRHVLPVLPFLFVSAGRVANLSRVPSFVVRLSSFVLLIWLAIGTLQIHPHYLAFFNELVGGPDQGYHYLVDSNTDWGQALKALHRYLEKEGIHQVRLSTYIEYGPAFEAYGLNVDPLPPLHAAPGLLPSRFNPPAGVYAISSTTLQGIFTIDPEMYDWFRHREPDARIGHVMLLYRVREPDVRPTWVAQCFVPVAPLSPLVLGEGFGRPGLREAQFDCTTSWLIPAGGRPSGWYVLARETARRDDAFIRAQLAPLHLSFEQTRPGAEPPFSIFEASAPPTGPTYPSPASVRVGDLTFLGHTQSTLRAEPQGEANLEIWTFWQVDALPDRPLSLMLHLIGPGGEPVVVGDGLGVPVENWQVGDIIVQRHALNLPPDAPKGEYTLYTGAYWLDTLERWPVYQDGAPAGDTWNLPSLFIQ
jgi:hypothetical protein